MKPDILLGLVLGALVAALSVIGNVMRAEESGISIYPDLLTAAVVPVVVYFVARRRRVAGAERSDLQDFGRRVGMTAGVAFALPLLLFSLWRFTTSLTFALGIAAALAVTAFALTAGLGWGAAALVARSSSVRTDGGQD